MKKITLLTVVSIVVLFGSTSLVSAQGVGVNSSGNPGDPSSIFDASSTTKGALIPRMTTAQRDAIASPAIGLLIFNTDCNSINYYNTGGWIAVTNSGGIGAAGSITGSTNPCRSATGVAYSISPVAGATSYNWTVPAGASVSGGQGTTSITVNFGTNSGNVCVTAGNACGSGIPSCITVSIYAPPIPVANLATGVTSNSFSANWAAVVAGVTTYYLDVSTDVDFTSFVSGYNNLNVGNVTTYSVTGLTMPACSGTPSFYYRIRAGSNCGISGNSNTIPVYSMTPLWTQAEDFSSVPSSTGDIVAGIAVDASGVYVAGYDQSLGNSNQQWRIEKRDLNTGAITWTQTENPSASEDILYAIALDATGFYVAGVDRSNGNRQWRIEKRNLNTGAITWTQTEDPSTDNDEVLAIAVDAGGVYVAGYDRVSGEQWRIEKRNLGTGAVIWTQTSNPTSNSDIPYAIAVDASGVYVAGYDQLSSFSNQEWRIEKRDLNSGALITAFGTGGVVTENPSTGNDAIYSITLDATGLYAAGKDVIPGNDELRIQKRDLSTGAVIWTQTENPSTSSDIIYGIALSATAVYVAGTDFIPGNNEWITEKRDLSTGNTIWINTRNPSSNSDQIQGIALDATGVYAAGYDNIPGNGEWRIEKYCK